MPLIVPLVCVEVPKQTSVHKFLPRYEAPLLLGLWRAADGIVTGYDPGNPVKIIAHPPGCVAREFYWRTIDGFDSEFRRLIATYGDALVQRLYPTQAQWEEACLRALKDAEAIKKAQAAAIKANKRVYIADPDVEATLEACVEEWQSAIDPVELEKALESLDAVGVCGVEGLTTCPLMKMVGVKDVSPTIAEFLKSKFPTPEAAPDHEARDVVPLPGAEAPAPA